MCAEHIGQLPAFYYKSQSECDIREGPINFDPGGANSSLLFNNMLHTQGAIARFYLNGIHSFF